jgi:hypothetical protein
LSILTEVNIKNWRDKESALLQKFIMYIKERYFH